MDLQSPNNFNFADSDQIGYAQVMKAVCKGDLLLLQKLVALNGALIHAVGHDSRNAMHLARAAGYPDTVKFLIRQGAPGGESNRNGSASQETSLCGRQ